jgi:hypothetical protein
MVKKELFGATKVAEDIDTRKRLYENQPILYANEPSAYSCEPLLYANQPRIGKNGVILQT